MRSLLFLFSLLVYCDAAQNYALSPSLVWTETGPGTDSRFGASLFLGDVNGDGRVEVIVSAYRSSQILTYSASAGGVLPSTPTTTSTRQHDYGYAMEADEFTGGNTEVMARFGHYYTYAERRSGDTLGTTTSYTAVGGTAVPGTAFSKGRYDGTLGNFDIAVGNVLVGYYDSVTAGEVYVYNNGGTGNGYKLTATPLTPVESYALKALYGHALASGRFQDEFYDLVNCGPSDGASFNMNGRCLLYKGRSGQMSSTPAWAYSPPTKEGAALTGAGGGQFGWSATAMDVNGDGFDDLIVGAPHGDVGKVYVFMGSATGLHDTPDQVLDGELADSFGYDLSNAGDLNQDGLPDLLVGAPLGGPNREGRVYAFVATAGGSTTSPFVQTPLWVMNNPDSTANSLFGFSVGGGRDVDGDGWVDVGVGAPRTGSSGTAYVFSSPPLADIKVTMATSMGGATFVNTPSYTWTYSLTVESDGPAVSNNVVLTVNKPAAMILDAFTATDGFSCSLSTGVCTIASMAQGESRTVVVRVRVPPSYTGPLYTSFAVENDGADPVQNNRAEHSCTAVCDATLTVTWSRASAAVPIGGTQLWTATVRNDGPSNANDATAVYAFPTGLGFVNASRSCQREPFPLSCGLGSMAPGETSTVLMTGLITKSITTDPLVSQLTVSSSCIPSNVVRSVSTDLTVDADLSVRLVASNPRAGDGKIAYSATIVNSGPSDANALVFTNTLPAGLTLLGTPKLSASYKGNPIHPDSECTVVGQEITCVFKDERPGYESTVFPGTATAAISYAVQVAVSGNVYTNEVSVTSSSPDSVPANNVDSVDASATVNADLTLTLTVEANPGRPGNGLVRYTILVGNRGPSGAINVVITDSFPAALTVPDGTGDDGLYARLSNVDGSCTFVGNDMTCNIASMDPYQNARVDILAAVTTTGFVSNTASVTSSTTDNNPADNSDTAGATPTVSCDLLVTQTAEEYLGAGTGDVRWRMVIENGGPSTARSVVLSDDFPDGVYIDDVIVLVTDSNAVCNATGGDGGDTTNACVVGGTGSPANTLTCNFASVAQGVRVTVAVVSHVLVSGNYSNTVSVTNAVTDSNLANNDDTVIARPTVDANMQVDVTAGFNKLYDRMGTLFTVTIKNTGPAVARGVTASVTLPTNVNVSHGATVTEPSLPATTVDCTVNGTRDVCPCNATANDTATCACDADVPCDDINDTCPCDATAPCPCIPGSGRTYTVGDPVAVAVSAGASYVSRYTLTRVGGTVTINFPDNFPVSRARNPVLFTVSFTVTGFLSDFSLANPIVSYNTSAAVTSSTYDSALGNNVDEATSTARAVANMVVSATVASSELSGNFVIRNKYFSFDFFINNLGPVAAIDFVFTAVLPEGLELHPTHPPTLRDLRNTGLVAGTPIVSGSGTAGDPTVLSFPVDSHFFVGPARVSFEARAVALGDYEVVGSVTTGTLDTVPENNNATVTFTAVDRCDMAASIVPSTREPVPKVGDDFYVLMKPKNNGFNAARSVSSWMLIERDFPMSIVTMSREDPSDMLCTLTKVAGTGFLNVSCTYPEVEPAVSISVRLSIALDLLMVQPFNISHCVASATVDEQLVDNCAATLITPISNVNADIAVNRDPDNTPSAAGGVCPGWFSGSRARMGYIITNNGPAPARNLTFNLTMDANIIFTTTTVTRDGGADASQDHCAIGDCTALPVLNPVVTERDGPARAAAYSGASESDPSVVMQLYDAAPPTSYCLLTCVFASPLPRGAVAKVLAAGLVYNLTAPPEEHFWEAEVHSDSPDAFPANNVNKNLFTCIRVQNVTRPVEDPDTVVEVTQEQVRPAKNKGIIFFLMFIIPIVVLLCCAAIAWRLGFFKRKRPPKDGEEANDVDLDADVFGD